MQRAASDSIINSIAYLAFSIFWIVFLKLATKTETELFLYIEIGLSRINFIKDYALLSLY
jgi:hypothetical protein